MDVAVAVCVTVASGDGVGSFEIVASVGSDELWAVEAACASAGVETPSLVKFTRPAYFSACDVAHYDSVLLECMSVYEWVVWVSTDSGVALDAAVVYSSPALVWVE